MTRDEIIESIRSICAPLPESRKLRDKLIAAVEEQLDALTLATEAFAEYALDTTTPTLDAVADFKEGFVQDARLRRAARSHPQPEDGA